MPNIDVLFVDPAASPVRRIASRISEGGLSVRHAKSSEECLSVCSDNDVTLAVLEHDLRSDTSGVRLAEEIKANFDVASLFLTSSTDTNSIRATTLVGAMACIAKATPEDLVVEQIRVSFGLRRDAIAQKKRHAHLAHRVDTRCRFEHLVGSYAVNWGVSVGRARSLLVRFARGRRIPLEQLATVHEQWQARYSSMYEEFRGCVEAARPETLSALDGFSAAANDSRRLGQSSAKTNARQRRVAAAR